MSFYIRELPNKSAMLMTREGRLLFTFKDVDSALEACRDWYGIGAQHVIPDLVRAANAQRQPQQTAA